MLFLHTCVFLCVCTQALDWIQETGEVYLATHTSPGDSSEETQQLLTDYHHFRLSAKVKDSQDNLTDIINASKKNESEAAALEAGQISN